MPAARPCWSAATTRSVPTRARWKTACSTSTSGTGKKWEPPSPPATRPPEGLPPAARATAAARGTGPGPGSTTSTRLTLIHHASVVDAAGRVFLRHHGGVHQVRVQRFQQFRDRHLPRPGRHHLHVVLRPSSRGFPAYAGANDARLAQPGRLRRDDVVVLRHLGIAPGHGHDAQLHEQRLDRNLSDRRGHPVAETGPADPATRPPVPDRAG